jgi:Tol biopolymer transport system component
VLLTSHPGRELEPALARDGQRIAFVWDGEDGDNFDLYTKVIGAETALRLTTHRAYDGTPAWSPDGRWIAFLRTEGSHGSVLLVPSTGGGERKLLDVDPWYGSSISFSPDGRSIAVSDRPGPGAAFGVVLVDVETRETRVVTRPDASFFAGDAFPAFSPDGRWLAFARFPAHGAALHWATLSVVSVHGGPVRSLARQEQVVGGIDWTPDGRHVVFTASRGYEGPLLWRVPAAGGAQARVGGHDQPMANLFGAETLTQVGRFYRISVAGERIVYAQSNYQTDIWRMAVGASRDFARLIASTQVDEAPQFSPDGRRIAFSSSRASKHPQIWVCGAQGSDCAQLTSFRSACGTPRWSPDSQRVAFDAGDAGQSEIYVADVGTRIWRRLTFENASDVVPSWSRDGESIYFASDRSGTFEVWRVPTRGGTPVPITDGGGFAAFESPDGRDIYFTRYATPGLWSVPAKGGRVRSVLDRPPCWGYWTLAKKGVYVLDPDGPRGPRIALHRWGAERLDHVADVPAAPACGESGLALSPDERTLLYVGTARTSDVVMLDGFR